MARISETINQMIQRILESAEWTSANPTHTNTLIQVNAVDNPDFETQIKQLVQQETKNSTSDTDVLKKEQEVVDVVKDVKDFKSGNIGDLQNFTSTQMGNVKSFATNPFAFIIGAFSKRVLLSKAGGAIAFALLFLEIVQIIIEQLMQPGRALDRRFKKLIDKQILVFTERKEQAELRQGFKEVRITTIGGLRGGFGQVGGNFYNPDRISKNYLDSRKLDSSIAAQDSRTRRPQSVFGSKSG